MRDQVYTVLRKCKNLQRDLPQGATTAADQKLAEETPAGTGEEAVCLVGGGCDTVCGETQKENRYLSQLWSGSSQDGTGGISDMSINIKKVIDLCVKRKQVTLFNEGEMQWLSDGCAVYPLLNMPLFNENTIRMAYAIPDGVEVKEVDGLPAIYSFKDVERAENQVFFEKIQLQITSEPLTSVRTQAGVTFFPSKCLKPIEDGIKYIFYINEAHF